MMRNQLGVQSIAYLSVIFMAVGVVEGNVRLPWAISQQLSKVVRQGRPINLSVTSSCYDKQNQQERSSKSKSRVWPFLVGTLVGGGLLTGAEVFFDVISIMMSELSLSSYLLKECVCLYRTDQGSVHLIGTFSAPFTNEAEFRVLLLNFLKELDSKEYGQELFFAINGIDSEIHENTFLRVAGELKQDELDGRNLFCSHPKISRLLVLYHGGATTDELRAQIVLELDFGTCKRSYLAWYRSDIKNLSLFERMNKGDKLRADETFDTCWKVYLSAKN